MDNNNKIISRLKELLSHVIRIRSSLYPSDWNYDHLYMVEQELTDIIGGHDD